jgi:Fe-S cluster biogenesis protein NfuA/Fe-S cluster assembly iron-binding protein IscA
MTPTITMTDLAKQKLDEYLAEEPDDTVVRLLVEDDGKYGLSLDQKGDGDTVVEGSRGITTVVEAAFAPVVDGLKVDYLDQGASSGFSLTGGKPHRAGKPVVIGTEPTPNPDALKFRLAFSVGPAATFARDSEGKPAAVEGAFAVDPSLSQVFLKERFATVTRAAGGPAWSELEAKLTDALSGLSEAKPAAPSDQDLASLEGRVAAFIASDVAPFLQRDGGDIELVGVEGGVAKVRLQGACGTCPSATATLQAGVQRRLVAEFGELEAVERV